MAIEAKKLIEKDELINKFYTVRAGLSVIAKESAKIRAAERRLEVARQKDENHDKAMDSEYKKDCSSYYEKLGNLEASLNEKKQFMCEKESALEIANNNKKELKSKTNKSYYNGEKRVLSYVILGVVAHLTLALLSGFGPSLPFVRSSLDIPLMIIIASVIEFLAFVKVKKHIVNKYGSRNKSLKIYEAETKLKEAKEDLAMAKKSVLEAEDEYNNYIGCKPEMEDYSFYKYHDDVIEAENEMNAVVAAATATAKAAKEALVEYTEGLLVEDDWKNVDLLIFYLKTGRADSLQDALLLVDKQRQTDQITEAISTAAKYVESSLDKISTKIEHLSTNISKEFNMLSKTIERNNTYLMGAISGTSAVVTSQINRLNEDMSRQNQALLSAQELNNALLAHSNTQSDELMNELRYNQKYWVK